MLFKMSPCLLFAHSVFTLQFLIRIRIVVATLSYLRDEAIKNNLAFNPNDWSMISMGKRTPQQNNVIDCGVFVAITVDFLMDNLDLQNFSQQDINFLRLRLSVYIIRGYLSI